MSELTNEQVVRLAKLIEGHAKEDPNLLWEMALEAAEGFGEEEYYRVFPEEETDEE